MKKAIIILLTLLFVTVSAVIAAAAPANPFVDVPAKHWAYDSIAKLAQAGIVDGYGDNTFRGDRTMTRYEMAQIVARAVARSDKADAGNKALIDKLAVEFAAELNNLGVRVAKLEEKTRISVSFETRIRYGGDSNKAALFQGTNAFDWRQRVYFNGLVNENVSYFGRLETVKPTTTVNGAISGNISAGNPSSQVGFNRAGFNVKNFLGTFDMLTIGRFGTSGWTPGLMQARHAYNDGISVVKRFGEVNLRAATFDVYAQSQINFFSLDFKPASNFKFGVAYQTENIAAAALGNSSPTTNIVWPTSTYPAADLKTKSFDVNASLKLGNFNLTGEYVTTKDQVADTTSKAYAIQLTNGISDKFYPTNNLVDPAKAHTDAFSVSYRKIERNAVPITSGFWACSNVFSSVPAGQAASPYMAYDNDVKGYYLVYQNVISKGIIWSAEYQSLKDATTGNYKDNLWNTSLQFYF